MGLRNPGTTCGRMMIAVRRSRATFGAMRNQDRPEVRGTPYERLTAWQACHDLVIAVCRETSSWPKSELYGLTSQVRGAAVSAAVNIVKGSARRGSSEFRQFLDASLGALAQLQYLLHLARDLDLTSPERWGELEALRDHAGRLTRGLYDSVGRAKRDGRRAEKPETRRPLPA